MAGISPIAAARPSRALVAAAILATALFCGPADAAASEPCLRQSFEGAGYAICAFDPRRDDIRVFWKAGDGKPFGKFQALADALKSHGLSLRFAVNGGIFQENFTPLGLYVEDGRELHRVDQRDGASNFHLKPNGVFYVGAGSVGVLETARFLGLAPQARYATQSGPMLVIDGKLHPKIQPTGTSAKIRNGVGVRADGQAVFAISDGPVTFHAFARLFRDRLGCPNALYLDGSISSLYAPALGRSDDVWPLGPMIGVVGPQP